MLLIYDSKPERKVPSKCAIECKLDGTERVIEDCLIEKAQLMFSTFVNDKTLLAHLLKMPDSVGNLTEDMHES